MRVSLLPDIFRTSNVENRHLVTLLDALVKDGAGLAHGLLVSGQGEAARADVEAHADNLEAELPGELGEGLAVAKVCAKLGAKVAHGRLVVGREDAENKLGLREDLLDLVQLGIVVKGHLLYVDALGESNVR